MHLTGAAHVRAIKNDNYMYMRILVHSVHCNIAPARAPAGPGSF